MASETAEWISFNDKKPLAGQFCEYLEIGKNPFRAIAGIYHPATDCSKDHFYYNGEMRLASRVLCWKPFTYTDVENTHANQKDS